MVSIPQSTENTSSAENITIDFVRCFPSNFSLYAMASMVSLFPSMYIFIPHVAIPEMMVAISKILNAINISYINPLSIHRIYHSYITFWSLETGPMSDKRITSSGKSIMEFIL